MTLHTTLSRVHIPLRRNSEPFNISMTFMMIMEVKWYHFMVSCKYVFDEKPSSKIMKKKENVRSEDIYGQKQDCIVW